MGPGWDTRLEICPYLRFRFMSGVTKHAYDSFDAQVGCLNSGTGMGQDWVGLTADPLILHSMMGLTTRILLDSQF